MFFNFVNKNVKVMISQKIEAELQHSMSKINLFEQLRIKVGTQVPYDILFY